MATMTNGEFCSPWSVTTDPSYTRSGFPESSFVKLLPVTSARASNRTRGREQLELVDRHIVAQQTIRRKQANGNPVTRCVTMRDAYRVERNTVCPRLGDDTRLGRRCAAA